MSKKEQKFFICQHCGNLVGMIFRSGVPLVCCGEEMTELVANTTDASVEKHVPVISQNGTQVTITVGSDAHPMTPQHHIAWVYLQTDQGGHRKSLNPGDEPKLEFALTPGEKLLAAYAYCNLHSLWKADA